MLLNSCKISFCSYMRPLSPQASMAFKNLGNWHYSGETMSNLKKKPAQKITVT